MRLSQLFTKTKKEAPSDEAAKNAKLLIRAGFIHKEMAGVYVFLPLGKKVLENIVNVIREEMNAIGGNEILMSALQRPEPWQASGRWDDEVMDIWFRTKLSSGGELGLGATHEEPLTDLMKQFISSYKDLPAYPYQFQTKFRNELRARSGIMRSREFLMKDLYSFSRDQAEHDAFYEKAAQAYDRVWRRLGIGDKTYKTFASGGSFSKFSHEYQTVSEVGEDTIFVHEGRRIAVNYEVYTDEVLQSLGLNRDEMVEKRAVEVGNIFTLGTKYSDALGLNYTAEDGTAKSVFMGSYGIGPSRVMGVIAELFADDKGLVWPENIAPAKVYLARLGDSEAVVAMADKLYEDLQSQGIEVLYDDRDVRPGEKFADSELMGIPHRVVVSERLAAEQKYEYKQRSSAESEVLTAPELSAKLV